MPKNPNSRPDIQVLEDRVVRLKSQIEEFRDLRLYKVTKERLARVCSELEECVDTLNDITGGYAIPVSSSSSTVFSEFSNEGLSEFSIDEDSDLNDVFALELPEEKSNYSPKQIVSTYSKRMQDCANTVGCCSGIIQVNQFIQILNSWYQARFTPSNLQRNPKFLFKAKKIPEWVDLLMLAAGRALNKGIFPAFISDIQSWIQDLNTPKDSAWALPFGVMQIQKSDINCYTYESIVLEKILKPSLYDKSFYIQNMHSIEDLYREAYSIPKEEMELDKILSKCPKLIVTSSFDLSKYQAVS